MKGLKVRNTVSGAIGTVSGVWLNQWTNQYVVNVRVNGMMASWNAVEVAVIETEKAA